MTAQPPVIGAMPRAPDEVTPAWANQLTRWLEGFARDRMGVILLRGNGIYLPGLPLSGYNLPVDSVYSNAGVLTLVVAGRMYPDKFSSMTASIGSVTVTP